MRQPHGASVAPVFVLGHERTRRIPVHDGTAALFLESFVDDTPWVHFDLMAWNTTKRPGRPEGGEAMGLRAVFDYLQQRFRGGE